DAVRLAACLGLADSRPLAERMVGLAEVPGAGAVSPGRLADAVADALAARLGVRFAEGTLLPTEIRALAP
ncbi:MAG TPA: hypothetical protein VNM66_01065, partial [Thermodesulfobacteriota bacterium]|nr:hypothetical protein [Thermodesulfobacteriota bacterium]